MLRIINALRITKISSYSISISFMNDFQCYDNGRGDELNIYFNINSSTVYLHLVIYFTLELAFYMSNS